MIDIIFTLDYEIYGDGTGALRRLVYEPTERLAAVFGRWDAHFVTFVEALEFEQIDAYRADPAIEEVKMQVNALYKSGFEIGLHLHPQWANARYLKGSWQLDASEYNLCTLPRERIAGITDRAIAYLRHVVDDHSFTPLSFRAGNWLFQPSHTAAEVLSQRGVRLDSSVFKGGRQRNHGLDYRSALQHGSYWPFESDVTETDPEGSWIEVPIYSEMVSPLRMARTKRMGLGNAIGMTNRSARRKINRILDFLRLQYPLKLDFCRLTLEEMTSMMGNIIERARRSPTSYQPVVAIGHTKDPIEFDAVERFLAFLKNNQVNICTFRDAFPRLSGETASA